MQKYHLIALAVLLAGILSGCAQNPSPPVPMTHWSRAETDQTTFMQDRYVCLQQAQQGRSDWSARYGSGSGSATVMTNGSLYYSCMAAHGYTIDPHGPLAAPQGMGVSTD
jgi:hypothetical protein